VLAQGSQLDFSLPPVAQIECAQPPVGGGGGAAQVEPQIEPTSLTHCASHVVLQQ
jgi:hypothetical protein